MATARLRKWEQVYSASYTLRYLEQSNVSDMHMFQLIQGGWKQFPVLSKNYILMGHFTHSVSVDVKIMVSNNCSIIGEHVTVHFVAQYVTIATVRPAKNALSFSFKRL